MKKMILSFSVCLITVAVPWSAMAQVGKKGEVKSAPMRSRPAKKSTTSARTARSTRPKPNEKQEAEPADSAPMTQGQRRPQGLRPYRISDREMLQLIEGIENQSDSLRRSLTDALDRTSSGSTNDRNDIYRVISDFENAVDRLHKSFDSRLSTPADVEGVLNYAARINDFMMRNRLTTSAHQDWAMLRLKLNKVASAYSISWRGNKNTQ